MEGEGDWYLGGVWVDFFLGGFAMGKENLCRVGISAVGKPGVFVRSSLDPGLNDVIPLRSFFL